jgi:MFS family permease
MSKPMLIPCIHLGIGGGGMTVVVSILFSDIIPLRERGTWQGYLNIVYAAGFSLGGPLGGLLTDTVGWRWQACLPPPFKSCLQLLGLSLDNSLSLSLQAWSSIPCSTYPRQRIHTGRRNFVVSTSSVQSVLWLLSFVCSLASTEAATSHGLIPMSSSLPAPL